MNDVVMATVAVLLGMAFTASALIRAMVKEKEKSDEQERLANYYSSSITNLGIEVRSIRETLRCLVAEIDYHIHCGAHDCICDEAREWRDGDISSSYMFSENGGTSLSGIVCPYCHMRTTGGDLMCNHCGAQIVDTAAVEIWGGR